MCLVLVVACSSSSPHGTMSGTLHMVGGPGDVDYPTPGTVQLVADNHTYSVEVGDDGRFTTAVAPGSYTLIGHSPQYGDGQYDCMLGTEQPVSVPSSATVAVTLECPMR
jgi:hypothetical protein